ncbi:hypothetical protein KCP73_18025 [Salmonella enterica subsp. enterica]|nr:hypothetical protein KCP73_18025 [Salmonella enterica subsp. enterica]
MRILNSRGDFAGKESGRAYRYAALSHARRYRTVRRTSREHYPQAFAHDAKDIDDANGAGIPPLLAEE